MPFKDSRWLGVNRREKMLAKAKNPKLLNAISQLYRPNSIIGDGSTASVLKFERETGIGLASHGRFHYDKAIQRVISLSRILKKEKLSDSDKKITRYLIKKLIKALGGNNKCNI